MINVSFQFFVSRKWPFLAIFDPPKNNPEKWLKYILRISSKTLLFWRISPKTLLRKKKLREMRQKKLNFFSWAIFGGVKNGRNLRTKNWKLTYGRIVRTNFWWVLHFDQIGGQKSNISKTPSRVDFFLIVLKLSFKFYWAWEPFLRKIHNF